MSFSQQTWRDRGALVSLTEDAKRAFLRRIRQAFDLHVFVETGTFKGDTIAALLDDFDALYTIELDDAMADDARDRFSQESKVSCLSGDSSKLIQRVLSHVTQPALFWLDAHYSGNGTARADDRDTPILAELEVILAHPFDHVIVIDDRHSFGADKDYPTVEEVESLAAAHGYSMTVVWNTLVLRKK